MPLAFHSDRAEKFEQQHRNARHYILPFIEEVRPVDGTEVLEIGCGEGGILKAFLERGCRCTGVDLSAAKIEFAREYLRAEIDERRISFIAQDIYDPEVGASLTDRFDLIVVKDTIEHIYGHERFLGQMRSFLREGGVVFLGFPPWRMPYGGHQQMADTTIGKLPYYHLLPRPLYRRLLKAFGESESRVEVLMEIVDTRLSIRDFEVLVRGTGYRVRHRRFYLINPIYEYKFGLKPVRQLPLLRNVPWVRDFVTTTCYYVVEPAGAPARARLAQIRET